MLRRRIDSDSNKNNGDNDDDVLLIDSYNKSQKDSVHTVSALSAIAIIIAGVFIFDIVVRVMKLTPTPLTIADEANHPGQFIAERAQNHLKQLTSIGPKVVGSYENEVLAVDFLKREINFVIQQSNQKQRIELDHQIVSGSYLLDFQPYSLINVYENVQNIVVRISAAINSNNSLLINCHFDSVPLSPGASDNGINCVVMLEVLRLLSKESIRPVNNIIFLFNGAEENPLQGAHGFITKHKWASEVRAVINLDSGGSGEKEFLFQAGPSNEFLLKAYANGVQHPCAQSSGEEIFQSNLIPSDTDFRVFRDFGHIPGLDFAFATNGYVYHTKYDKFDTIKPGTYQHVGDNVLGIVKNLAFSTDFENGTRSKTHSEQKFVYFDIMGLILFVYSDFAAIILNVITIVASGLVFVKMISDIRQNSLFDIGVNILSSFGIQTFSLFLSLSFVIVLSFVLDQFNLTMSWYTRPQIIFGLFFCPCLILLSSFLIIFNTFVKNVSLSLGTRAQVHVHSARMIWTFLLLLTTIFTIRMSYIFLIPVLFNTIGCVIISFFNLQHTRRTWLYAYLISLIIPTIHAMSQVVILLEVMIPITGRMGSNKNPDVFIGMISTVGCILIVSGFVPLVTLTRKPGTVLLGLLVTFIVTILCIGFTSYGFPYSVDPSGESPQRFLILHTNRVFHDVSGNIRKEDSGYFLLNLDYNSPRSIERYVPEFQNALSIEKDCDEYVYCGLPIYSSRMITIHKESTWIPSDPAVIHEPVTLKLLTKTNISSTVTRYTFRATGPDHYSIFVSPRSNVTVTKWSLSEEIPERTYTWHGRPTYFIMYGYGEVSQNWDFWIDLERSVSGWKEPVMDIVISGKYTHHVKTLTPKYKEFLSQFPDWAHVTAWMANYHSWII